MNKINIFLSRTEECSTFQWTFLNITIHSIQTTIILGNNLEISLSCCALLLFFRTGLCFMTHTRSFSINESVFSEKNLFQLKYTAFVFVGLQKTKAF